MDKKAIFRLKTAILLITAAVFAAMILWLVLGLTNTKNMSAQQQLEELRRSVTNGIVICYSVEGAYPESLDYLKEHYGLSYDADKYLVHYRFVSADIKPSVVVAERI